MIPWRLSAARLSPPQAFASDFLFETLYSRWIERYGDVRLKRALVVGGLVWLPTNREPGANPGRPRRCKRALARSILFEAIIGAFGLVA